MTQTSLPNAPMHPRADGPVAMAPGIRRAQVLGDNEAHAAASLAAALAMPDSAGTMFFCSPDYDPEWLATELNQRFDEPLIGCTTAGEIGERYQTGGITAIAFPAESFQLHTLLIDDVDQLNPAAIRQRLDAIRTQLRFGTDFDPERMFGYLLIDGLSMKEEMVAAILHAALPQLRILGGSAGDALRFKETRVFADGGFRAGRAVLVLIETRLDFELFKFQHFEPTEVDMVVTGCVPNRRFVSEIDGEPAARRFAEIIGVDPGSLDPQTFSNHPLMLEIGNEWNVRAIEKVTEDGGLTFYCAIDYGLPLTLGRSTGLARTLAHQIAALQARFTRIDATLGCDCILRRLEMTQRNDTEAVEALLGQLHFVGFNTYGEQFNGVHVNQTLVGVVL